MRLLRGDICLYIIILTSVNTRSLNQIFRMCVCRMMMMVMMVSAMMMMESQVKATPLMGDCSINSHCGPSACCVVGYDRYSFPQCSPLGEVGSWCRIMSSPRPMTLAYPNGLMIHLQDAYHGMCPCRPGLVCSRMSSTCQLPEIPVEEENSLNSLF